MSSIVRYVSCALLATTIAGCSTWEGMSKRERSAATGAAVGGVTGAAVSGGGVLGTVGGAAVGGVIGNEIGKDRERRP